MYGMPNLSLPEAPGKSPASGFLSSSIQVNDMLGRAYNVSPRGLVTLRKGR